MGIEKHEMIKLISELEAKLNSMSEDEGKQETMQLMGFVAGRMLEGYIEQDPEYQRITFLRALDVVARICDQLPRGGPRISEYEVMVICCSALAHTLSFGEGFCFPGSGHVPDNTLGESIASAIAAARFSIAAREISSGHFSAESNPACCALYAENALHLLGEKPEDVFED